MKTENINEVGRNDGYNITKLVWNDIHAGLIHSVRRWQLATFLSLTALIVSGYANIKLYRQPTVVPIAVDPLTGSTVAVSRLSASDYEDKGIIRAQLFRFIENWRAILFDGEAMKKNLREASQALTRELQTSFFRDYYRSNNPFEIARNAARDVHPISCLKHSEKTYLIEWKEIERSRTNELQAERHFKAVITIGYAPPRRAEEINDNPYNPFGIYITRISWEQIQQKEKE